MKLSLPFFSFFLVLMADAHAQTGPDSYAWPLDAPQALTSTYAEYRSGRFHAGLDVKTWGKEGYPCLAVADGYVWRVRTSPWGYGKAVYLKLADGNTAVYAHLSAFMDPIEEVVAAEQDRRGAYSLNLYLQPGQIPVRKGEVVAFSGSTGSGYPHLHFEIRDRRQRPLNPLTHGFDVEDTTDPTLLEVAFIPLDGEALVDGRNVPAFRGLRSESDGFRGEHVHLWGRLGLAVKVYDRADASALTNKLAPYRLALIVDGQTLVQTTYDAFSYDQVREVDLDRNFALNREGRRGFHNLYVERGNTLPLYGDRPIGSGVIAAGDPRAKPGSYVPEGPHTIQIVAEDAVGNRTIAEIPFTVKAPIWLSEFGSEVTDQGRFLTGQLNRTLGEAVTLLLEASQDGEAWQWFKTLQLKERQLAIRVSDDSGPFFRARFTDGSMAIATFLEGDPGGIGQIEVDRKAHEDRSVLTVTATSAFGDLPRMTTRNGAQLRTTSVSERAVEAVMPGSSRFSPVRILARTAEGLVDSIVEVRTKTILPTGGELRSDDGQAIAVFESASVYRELGGHIESVDPPDDSIKPVGKAYRFSPGTVPFRKMVHVHFSIPQGERLDGLGVYEWTDKGWSFVWNDVDSTRNTVWAGVRHFSTYGLLRDDAPPEVTVLSPQDGATTDRTPKFAVALKDSLSGIPMEELISFRLDGETMIFEYDPEADEAKGLLRQPLSPGKHRFVVRVRDTSGNETVEESRFQVK